MALEAEIKVYLWGKRKKGESFKGTIRFLLPTKKIQMSFVSISLEADLGSRYERRTDQQTRSNNNNSNNNISNSNN